MIDAKTRAEKIFPVDPLHPHIGKDLRDQVAAQIAEAEREAVRKAIIGSFSKEYDLKFKEGFAAAREKAKGIAEERIKVRDAIRDANSKYCCGSTTEFIVQDISKMEPDEGTTNA